MRENFIALATIGKPSSVMALRSWADTIGLPVNDLLGLFEQVMRTRGIPLWVMSDLGRLIRYMQEELGETRRRHGLNRAKMRAVLPALEEAWDLVRLGASGDDPKRG